MILVQILDEKHNFGDNTDVQYTKKVRLYLEDEHIGYASIDIRDKKMYMINYELSEQRYLPEELYPCLCYSATCNRSPHIKELEKIVVHSVILSCSRNVDGRIKSLWDQAQESGS